MKFDPSLNIVGVDARAYQGLRTAATPIPKGNFLRSLTTAERNNCRTIGTYINCKNPVLVRLENGGYRSASRCIPNRNHAVFTAVRGDDELLVVGNAHGSNGIGMALQKAHARGYEGGDALSRGWRNNWPFSSITSRGEGKKRTNDEADEVTRY